MNAPLVLASQSPYRKKLLQRLGVAFDVAAPGVDESAVKRAGGSPEQIAAKLARLKAEAVARARPEAIVIGSDQVAVLDGQLLDKPGSPEKAKVQLAALAGKTHRLITAVCVLHLNGAHEWTEFTDMTMRPLTREEIDRYVEREDASDCVGSYKIEGLGISLMAGVQGKDPTSIEGLPLISLASALRKLGLL